MRVDLPGGVHLTYCTDIDAGESWTDIRAALAEHVPVIKAEISPRAPMGIGLRLSGYVTRQLAHPSELAAFRWFLNTHNLYVFTITTFPSGPFRGGPIKERVYKPDWLSAERVDLTDRTARVLGALLPEGVVGSVSTVPGALKPQAFEASAIESMAFNMARHVVTLIGIERRTGREIVLALEPEPGCFLESTEDVVAFFRDYLFGADIVAYLAEITGLDRDAARAALRRHLGVCYDVCHGALEFEDPRTAFATLAAAGIRIAKVQLGTALRLPQVGPEVRELLARVDDGIYLHQVVERRDGITTRHLDLTSALEALRQGRAGGEWRVHCHAPVIMDGGGPVQTTQQTLREALAVLRERPITPHLEVETYTWELLPDALRGGTRAQAIARELRWVLDQLTDRAT